MSKKTPIEELDLLSQLLISERKLKDKNEKIQKQKEFEEYHKNLEEIKIKLPDSISKFQKKINKIDK